MSGAQLRMRRFFDGESGRSYIVAIDHGLAFGPQPGNEDAYATVDAAMSSRPDGVLLSPGLLERSPGPFGARGAASPIVRLDFFGSDPRVMDRYGDLHRMLVTPAQAAQLGADSVVAYLVLGVGDGAGLADNLQAVAQATQEAHAVGLPMIVEVTLWGSQAEDRKDADLLGFGSRIAAEAGADAIKTEWTGDAESMRSITGGVPVPVLVLGGARTSNVDALLDATRDALGAGAAGVIYGRNVWQADDPAGVGGALRDLVHEPAATRA